MFPVLGPEEAQGNTTAWTRKLASYRGLTNQSRDFWRAIRLPLESERFEWYTFAWLGGFGRYNVETPTVVTSAFVTDVDLFLLQAVCVRSHRS